VIDLTININEIFSQVTKWVQTKINQVNAGSKQSVQEAAKIVNDEIVSSIRSQNAIASGELLRSVTVGSMSASSQGFEMTVGSSSPYASFIEEGRRAGSRPPPVDAILEWMTQKGLEPDKSAAYLIARKIGRDGIPAKHVFARGVASAENKISEPINVIMDTSLQKD
jgi:hypothetical protein